MRGKKVKKRTIDTDPVYKSKLVTKFVNHLMLDGKKNAARKAVYGVLEELSEDKKEAIEKFEEALKSVMPKQEVRSRRVGGATYQVPVPLKHERAEALAIRWIVDSARKRKGIPLQKKVFAEFEATLKGESAALKKRDEVHKMADANKAFAHFKW